MTMYSEFVNVDRKATLTRLDQGLMTQWIVEMYIDKENSDYSEWSLRTAKLVRKNSKNGGLYFYEIKIIER